jgi:hypothetical protein
MDKKLRHLETFSAIGEDGVTYTVRAYEHLAAVALVDSQEQWEPTGLAEYKLADGSHINVGKDDSMVVSGTGLRLKRAQ